MVIPFGRRVVLFGNELFHLVPKGRRGLSGLAFEDLGEVGFFVVAQFKTDFGNGLVGVDEQVFGLCQFSGLDDFPNALLHHFLADEVEVAFAHEQFFGVERDFFRPSEVFLQNAQKIGVGLGMGVAGFLLRILRLFIIDHGEQSGEQLFNDGQVGMGSLYLVVHHFTKGGEPAKTTVGGQGDVGPVVEIPVQVKNGLRHELTSEPDDPKVTFALMDLWTEQVRFALGHKTHERGIDRFIIKIDKMGNFAFDPNDQFFKIVDVRFYALAFEGVGIFGGKSENLEEFLHGFGLSWDEMSTKRMKDGVNIMYRDRQLLVAANAVGVYPKCLLKANEKCDRFSNPVSR